MNINIIIKHIHIRTKSLFRCHRLFFDLLHHFHCLYYCQLVNYLVNVILMNHCPLILDHQSHLRFDYTLKMWTDFGPDYYYYCYYLYCNCYSVNYFDCQLIDHLHLNRVIWNFHRLNRLYDGYQLLLMLNYFQLHQVPQVFCKIKIILKI